MNIKRYYLKNILQKINFVRKSAKNYFCSIFNKKKQKLKSKFFNKKYRSGKIYPNSNFLKKIKKVER